MKDGIAEYQNVGFDVIHHFIVENDGIAYDAYAAPVPELFIKRNHGTGSEDVALFFTLERCRQCLEF